jgi:hypothetical protein
MFGPRRRGVPFAGLLLFAGGFALASLAGGAGSAIGFVFFLPLLALKLMFVFFVFGTFMRFAGRGFGWGGPPWPGRAEERRQPSSPPREPTQEEEDWARARREALQEIDDLFPDRPE